MGVPHKILFFDLGSLYDILLYISSKMTFGKRTKSLYDGIAAAVGEEKAMAHAFTAPVLEFGVVFWHLLADNIVVFR